MRGYIDAARISGRKNLDGRLAVAATAGLPFLLREGIEAHFVPPTVDGPRSAVVESVAMQGEGAAIVAFAGVGDASAADLLVGSHCLVARSDVDAEALAAAGSSAAFLFAGWAFEDAASGARGSVLRAEELPGQTLLAVTLEGEEAAGGKAVEHLVPLVDEFVLERDEGARRLVLSLPQGIFEL